MKEIAVHDRDKYEMVKVLDREDDNKLKGQNENPCEMAISSYDKRIVNLILCLL